MDGALVLTSVCRPGANVAPSNGSARLHQCKTEALMTHIVESDVSAAGARRICATWLSPKMVSKRIGGNCSLLWSWLPQGQTTDLQGDGAKLGQDGAKLGQDCAKLGRDCAKLGQCGAMMG